MRAQVRQADLVRPYKPIPEIGWRKKLHQLTRINAGVGPAEREWIDLKRRGREVYRRLDDGRAARHGLIRVVDESGEDYLYPSSYFVSIALPKPAQRALARAQ